MSGERAPDERADEAFAILKRAAEDLALPPEARLRLLANHLDKPLAQCLDRLLAAAADAHRYQEMERRAQRAEDVAAELRRQVDSRQSALDLALGERDRARVGRVEPDLARIEAIPHPVLRIQEATSALEGTQALTVRLSDIRRKAIDGMIEDGFTLAEIGVAVGLSAARIGQLSTRARRPRP